MAKRAGTGPRAIPPTIIAEQKDPVAEPAAAIPESDPDVELRPWIDYCPKCAGRDIRPWPIGNDSKTIGRLVCGRCNAFEMKSNVFTEE